MPVPLNYPGVYVQELPSGRGEIAGVPTSIAAFVGRAPKGSTSAPITVFSFGDYAREFGGLAFHSPMSYAVQDFFNNGGTQAVIARLFEALPGEGDGVARLRFASSLSLRAASPGLWGNFLVATVDQDGVNAEIGAPYGLTAAELFNLTLRLDDAAGQVVATERFLNVSVRAEGVAGTYPNRLDRVLESQSRLARVEQLSEMPPETGSTATGEGGNDGTFLSPATYIGDETKRSGLHLLDEVPIFNLLCIPPDHRIVPEEPEWMQDLNNSVRQAAAAYCTVRRAMFIADPPASWTKKAKEGRWSEISLEDLGITGQMSGMQVRRNVAVYFPRVWEADLLTGGQPALFAPCGAIAGVIASTDTAEGVWKAPAGTNAGLAGVTALELNLTDSDNGVLNPMGINCLRHFPQIGNVVWGARTMMGADQTADDYKYIPVRRLTLYIESSIMEGTQWAVFEPNDEGLWSSLRLEVNAFLAGLASQGAFFSFHVTCDATTTTATDIANGVVNILVQIAPVKPAEFVVIQIQQVAGANAG